MPRQLARWSEKARARQFNSIRARDACSRAALTTISIILILGLATRSWGQQASKSKWVPFVAKFVVTNTIELPHMGNDKIHMSGPFVRDGLGSSYRRQTVNRYDSRLPVQGQVDIGFLYDRPHRKMYILDFARKTVKEEDPPDTPLFAVDPISPEEFEKLHAGDKFLGTMTISGVECDGYAVHSPRQKGKYSSEVWYAPSLNYLAVKTRTRPSPEQEQVTVVEDIHAGEEPDRSYFRIPAGLNNVK
ncbi:MAG: hypothetical protein LAP13_19830 [Acidobacteriia bacterium]|nr:hypothetical protein [Terriglobia bacterium]